MTTLRLPPGRYFIGDPCYVFDNKKPTWDRLLDTAENFQNGDIITFDGHQLWAFSTAYGDGRYPDQNGVEYGVDSGLLGAIPIELIEDPAGEEHGTMLDAPNGLTVEVDNHGTFWFGNIVIKTDTDEEEDDPYSGDPDDDEFV